MKLDFQEAFTFNTYRNVVEPQQTLVGAKRLFYITQYVFVIPVSRE